MIFNQTITRVRAGTRTDRSGNELKDWSPDKVDRRAYKRVSVQPAIQSETTDATRTAVTTGLRVLTAPGVDVDVLSDDRVEVGGVTYEIDGEVARWPDPLRPGRVHHVEFSLVRVTG